MEIQLNPTVYNGGYHIRCHGDNNGAITTVLIGGEAPFSFLWNTGSVQQSLNTLYAGTYTVTVTQNGGVTQTASITLNEPHVLDPGLYSATYQGGTNISVNGGEDGSIELTDQGGTPPYTFLWSNNSVEQNLYNLTAGTYTVTVTDMNVCTTTRSIILTEPAVFTLVSITSPQYNGFNLHCNEATNEAVDGSIDITVTGGTPPYAYQWSNGSFDEDPTGLPAGDYDVRITDANNIEIEGSITLTEPPALTLTLTVFEYPNNYNISLFGGYDGSITTSAGGGVAPLSFLWNDGNTLQNRTTLNHGTKILTVTDANGCLRREEGILLEPASMDWMRDGNAGTDPGTEFIGTNDSADFVVRTNNQEQLRLHADGKLKIKNLESINVGLDLVFVDEQGILQKKPPCSQALQRTEPWILGGNFIFPDPPNVSGTDQRIGTCNDHNFVMISNGVERARITVGGNIGIGTISPQNLLDVNGSLAIGTGYAGNYTAPTNGLIIEGNVGIGTEAIPAGYKLAVYGKIICEEVKVKLHGVWPDYVFMPDYKLPTIQQTEKFIKENGHLVDVPAADKIKNDGYNLGEMDATLLKKIEELTLYVIELYKKNVEQEKEINNLKNSINQQSESK